MRINLYGASVNFNYSSSNRIKSVEGITWTQVDDGDFSINFDNRLQATLNPNRELNYNYYKVEVLDESEVNVVDTKYYFDVSSGNTVVDYNVDTRVLRLDVIATHYDQLGNLSLVNVRRANLGFPSDIDKSTADINPIPDNKMEMVEHVFDPEVSKAWTGGASTFSAFGYGDWPGYFFRMFKSEDETLTAGLNSIGFDQYNAGGFSPTVYWVFPANQYFDTDTFQIADTLAFQDATDVKFALYPFKLYQEDVDGYNSTWQDGFEISGKQIKRYSATYPMFTPRDIPFSGYLDLFKTNIGKSASIYQDDIIFNYEKFELHHLEASKELDPQLIFKDGTTIDCKFAPDKEGYELKFDIVNGNLIQKTSFSDNVELPMISNAYGDWLRINQQQMEEQRNAIKLQEYQSSRNDVFKILGGVAAIGAGIVTANPLAVAAGAASAGSGIMGAFATRETANQSIDSLNAKIGDMKEIPSREGATAQGVVRVKAYDKFKFRYRKIPTDLRNSILIHHHLYGYSINRYVNWSDLTRRSIFAYIEIESISKYIRGATVANEIIEEFNAQFNAGVRLFKNNDDVLKMFAHKNLPDLGGM